ncbi:cornifelin homolog B-like isoform X2 [Sparus aurata]|uniref:cornifelin homolog B-like isoform X2 n=1 Tax=Sparus aurata TaxID=8175 RepID=UPI0011C1AC97|nr:cornifelin homolog B-like isoform X2 [Sparus aurata]
MSVPVWSQPQRLVFSSDDGEWTSGICDCCDDMRECCFAFWCCPCFACKTAKAYGQCLCLPLLDIFSCTYPITMSMRVSIRQRYGIRFVPRLFVLYLLSILRLVSDVQRDEEQETPHRAQ